MKDLKNKQDRQILIDNISEYIKNHDVAAVITTYPLNEQYTISREHQNQNLAIQLILRRYRNRVFEFSYTAEDKNQTNLTTLYVAVDLIGHKNLDRICPKIKDQFSVDINTLSSTELNSHWSRLAEVLSLSEQVSSVDHGLSRYPTELRTIFRREQQLKQDVIYDI